MQPTVPQKTSLKHLPNQHCHIHLLTNGLLSTHDDGKDKDTMNYKQRLKQNELTI